MTPIRRAVIVGITAPTVVLLAAFSAVVVVRVRADAIADLDADLRGRAASLAGLLERDTGVWDMDPVPRDLSEPLIEWRITEPTGGAVAASPPDAAAAVGAERGPRRALTETFEVRTDDRAYHAVVVSVVASTAGIDERRATLLATLLGAGVVVVLLAIAAGVLVSSRIVDSEEFARLTRAFDRQTRFTADASHELRTPLASVLVQADVALRKERTPEEYQSALRGVVDGVGRMQRIVEALLVLARTDESAPRAREPVDLAAIARDVAARAERPVSLDVEGACTVTGDAHLLELAVGNVVGNALKHSTGDVRVAVRREGADVVVTVTDQGPGIPPDALPRVFERFFRVDEARHGGGAGLGLSIVQAVAQQHGGAASIASELARGTTVTLRFKAEGS